MTTNHEDHDMSSVIAGATNEIFCSYAHGDLPYIEAFRSHLRQLEREGMISCWFDGLIGAGQQWRREIELHLKSANIILLFISPDFLESDFCMEFELPIALQRSDRKEALVIPVIARQCDWQTARFAHLQALPREGKPIAQWRHRDAAYTEIVKSIRGFVCEQQVPPMRCLLLNLPFQNRLFTGRLEVLHRLHASLASKETALIQAISGLGGIGKSQTAIEYAYRYHDHYTRIIWLNSDSRETIISDVVRLAREINTSNCYDQDQNLVTRGFLTWLESQRNWLLILDNVEDIALVRSYLPKGNQGHLLLTTRRQAVGGAIKSISLNAMNEAEGGAFLLKRAKRIVADLPPEQIPAKEMQSAMHLSRVLGGLPLALDQAGGYIERKQCSLERYLQIYEQAHERLLAESGFPEDTTDYKYTVATTWSLSFRQIALEEHGQAATHLLWLCAFLAPDNIPVPMLEKVPAPLAIDLFGPDLGQVSADPVQLEEVLETLLKYSLIRREDNNLFIHRLVQTVLRDGLIEEERCIWVERTIHLMNRFFPDPNDPANWPICRYLLAHALICAEWATRAGIRTELSALLLSRTGYFLNSQGSYRQAESLYKQALEIRRAVLGEKHPDTARSLNNLGDLYLKQGRYEEAEPLYKQALAIRREALGEQHLDTATSLGNLAVLYQSRGRYEEAEPLYNQALEIKRAALGEQHPLAATILSNLGEFYRSLGRYEEAEPLSKQALKIRQIALGEQHPDTAWSLNSLGLLYQSQGRYEEAERSYKEALAIRQAVLGEQHPDTAQSLNNLGELYRSQRKYEEAERLLKRALAIWRAVLGEQHPFIAMSLNNLGLLYFNQGRKEATLLFEQALVILANVLGKDHPETQAVFSHYIVSLSNGEG
jgi:tetratricopeptide (TPR) repeat protein